VDRRVGADAGANSSNEQPNAGNKTSVVEQALPITVMKSVAVDLAAGDNSEGQTLPITPMKSRRISNPYTLYHEVGHAMLTGPSRSPKPPRPRPVGVVRSRGTSRAPSGSRRTRRASSSARGSPSRSTDDDSDPADAAGSRGLDRALGASR
jgi:hypothetical protein